MRVEENPKVLLVVPCEVDDGDDEAEEDPDDEDKEAVPDEEELAFVVGNGLDEIAAVDVDCWNEFCEVDNEDVVLLLVDVEGPPLEIRKYPAAPAITRMTITTATTTPLPTATIWCWRCITVAKCRLLF